MKVGLEAWLKTNPDCGRVALLSHQAALLSDGFTAAQAMRTHFGDRLIALFGPEHGYFGTAAAGEKTVTAPHPVWNIPVHSLYGEHRKPTPEMLQGIDTLVIDLQDIGVRCYTYLATLKLTLEACAEAGITAIVCERPIPAPGKVSGPVAEPEHFSFVAPCALPLVYGLTHPEAAEWLGLPHIPARMEGYIPAFRRPNDAPEFLPPSPAIRSWETARLYPATVFAEALPQIDIARNTPYAFRVLSAPWFDGPALADALNTLRLPGIHFFDHTQAPGYGGIRLHLTDSEAFAPWETCCALLRTLQSHYGDAHLFGHPDARPGWMTKLCGTNRWALEITTAPQPLSQKTQMLL